MGADRERGRASKSAEENKKRRGRVRRGRVRSGEERETKEILRHKNTRTVVVSKYITLR